MHIYVELKQRRLSIQRSHEESRFVFLISHLFCTTVQPGLSKLLFNINFVEGRPSLVSDLNIVAAILAAGQPLASDVEGFSSSSVVLKTHCVYNVRVCHLSVGCMPVTRPKLNM